MRYRRPYNSGHGTDAFFKDYASWISSKQDMSELDKIEGKLGGISLYFPQKETATRKWLFLEVFTGGDGGSVSRHAKSLKKLTFSHNGVAGTYHIRGSNGRIYSPTARQQNAFFWGGETTLMTAPYPTEIYTTAQLAKCRVYPTEQLASTFPFHIFFLDWGYSYRLMPASFLSRLTSPECTKRPS